MVSVAGSPAFVPQGRGCRTQRRSSQLCKGWSEHQARPPHTHPRGSGDSSNL